MEITKKQTAESTLSVKKAQEFVGEIKTEIKKVNWTEPEELRVYTQIVVIATFVLGLGIYSVDLVVQSFLDGLALLIRFIGG